MALFDSGKKQELSICRDPAYEIYRGTSQNWNGLRIIKRDDSVGFVWTNFSMINTEHITLPKNCLDFSFMIPES